MKGVYYRRVVFAVENQQICYCKLCFVVSLIHEVQKLHFVTSLFHDEKLTNRRLTQKLHFVASLFHDGRLTDTPLTQKLHFVVSLFHDERLTNARLDQKLHFVASLYHNGITLKHTNRNLEEYPNIRYMFPTL